MQNVPYSYLAVIMVLIAGTLISIKIRKLTVSGGITGGFTGLIIFTAARYTGIVILGTFFIIGTAVTSWKKNTKNYLQSPDGDPGKRNAGQVMANAGTAVLISLVSLLWQEKIELFCYLIAASFASATADTVSSELGMVYGRRFYNILTWKKDEKGLDGVVSLEGTLAGICGSVLIACIYAAAYGLNTYFIGIIIAGTIGNAADSVLGAGMERRRMLSNDAVNFLNTLCASFAALLLSLLF